VQPVTRPELRSSVHALLADLGSSPGAVADTLAAQGVQGVPGNSAGCAVARYLFAVVGVERSIRSIQVLHGCVRIKRERRPALRLPLPAPVARFVAGFDAGRYPALIVPPARGGAGTPG